MTNPLILIRPEIVNIAILLFLIFYDRLCMRYQTGKNYFLPFALTSLGHVVFALITEITVNSEDVNPVVNMLCHVVFLSTSIIYVITYCKYVLTLVFSKRKSRRLMIPVYAISALLVPFFFLTKIVYYQGNGTKYSGGPAVILCYLVGFLFCIFSDILIIRYRKNIERSIVLAILPISFVTMALFLIQLLVPEFLFSGSSQTISVISIFFAIENPLSKFEHAAFVDLKTGVYNRNRYEFDVKKFDGLEKILSVVIFDMNGLKKINDTYGHIIGDSYIIETAEILTSNLNTSLNLYRVGGDEFAAVYEGENISVIEKEIGNVIDACKQSSKMLAEELSISYGFSTKAAGEKYIDAVNRADKNMYEYKKAFYENQDRNRRSV